MGNHRAKYEYPLSKNERGVHNMSSKVLYSRHGLLVKGYAWNTKPYGIRLNIQILVVHVPLVLQISLTQYLYLGCNIVFLQRR